MRSLGEPPMAELSLFSNQTPSTTEVGGATPAAAPSGAPRAAVSGGTTPNTECPSDQRVAPVPPAASPTGGSGRGGLSSVELLGLLDALVGGLGGLGGGRLEECLRLVGRCEARLAAVKADKIAELARWRGEAHAAGVLRDELKQSRGGAKRDVKFAERLGDLPKTAKALAAGDVTPQAARAIADAAAHTPVDEDELLGAAETEPGDVFARTVRDHVNERTAAVDLEERRRHQRSRREANIKQESDGMYKLFGTFDPLAGARIETALAAMAKQLWHAEDPKRRSTPAQRYADALEALITRQGAGADTAKAQRTTLVVVADYDLVTDQLADARLIDGTPLAPSELLKIALEADILPALFDSKGQPLWLGHKCRTASVAQRVALAIRDKGCVICGAANSYCQAHHVIHWEDGGPTDIDNLCLLCSDCHHKQIHELGADLIRQPDGTYRLEHPPNLAGLASRNGQTRTAKARTAKAHTGKAHAGKRGRPGHRTANHPLQC
ncbi:MAG: DUF222 domain-containing protein [Acidimicrobiia bacterium]|nr:DUF222 domain-containing protein [Acidimicrobiia bacterium]